MQTHFNETLANVSEASYLPIVIACAVAVLLMAATFYVVVFLINSRSESKRALVTPLLLVVIGVLGSGAAVSVIGSENSKHEAADASRSERISQLVIDTLDPTFEDEKVASIRLLPVSSNGAYSPELRLSAETEEPQIVFASSGTNFEEMNLEAWAYDLSEGERPTVAILYQDGKIKTVEAGFTSTGEFALTPFSTK